MRSVFLLFASTLLLASTLGATERRYELGGEPKNTNITFESETELETILGVVNQAAGGVSVDLVAGSASAEISVPVEAMRTGIDLRDKHLRSSDWLDAKKFPSIRFVSTGARRINAESWQIDGTLSLHGVERPLSVTAQVKPIPASIAQNAGLGKGDWLRIRVPFEVRLSEHGVKIPEKVAGRVSDTWKINLSLFAGAGK